MLKSKEYQLIELLLKTEKNITNKSVGNFISTEKIEFRDARLEFNGNFLIITQTTKRMATTIVIKNQRNPRSQTMLN